MVPAESKVKRLSSVNDTTKTIHHHSLSTEPLYLPLSDFDSENKGSLFESGSWLCAEVSSLQ